MIRQAIRDLKDDGLGIRVLVCGGEKLNYPMLHNVLCDLHAGPRVKLIITNGSTRGAARMVTIWAEAHDVPVRVFRPNHLRFPFFAIALSNRDMLAKGLPNLVVATPGGIGTADLLRRARAADIKTWRLS